MARSATIEHIAKQQIANKRLHTPFEYTARSAVSQQHQPNFEQVLRINRSTLPPPTTNINDTTTLSMQAAVH